MAFQLYHLGPREASRWYLGIGFLIKTWGMQTPEGLEGPSFHVCCSPTYYPTAMQFIWSNYMGERVNNFSYFSKVFALHLGQKLNSNHCRFYMMVFVVQLFCLEISNKCIIVPKLMILCNLSFCMLTYPLLSR